MLDFLLIQDAESGINLFEYSGPRALIDDEHSHIFSGFLAAIQKITVELHIGDLTQIATKDHHCLFHQHAPVNVVALVDEGDDVLAWRARIQRVASAFVGQFRQEYRVYDRACFRAFQPTLAALVELPGSIACP